MTEVAEELNKATVKIPLPTFDKLMSEAKKADDDRADVYRIHIQKLIENDFIYVTFVAGASRLEVTAKRDGYIQTCALILQILKESLVKEEAEESYHSTKSDDNTGYA